MVKKETQKIILHILFGGRTVAQRTFADRTVAQWTVAHQTYAHPLFAGGIKNAVYTPAHKLIKTNYFIFTFSLLTCILFYDSIYVTNCSFYATGSKPKLIQPVGKGYLPGRTVYSHTFPVCDPYIPLL